MIALRERTSRLAADARTDDEYALLRLVLDARGRVDCRLPAMRDRVAGAVIAELIADPSAPLVDVLRRAAEAAGVTEHAMGEALRDRLVDSPIACRDPAAELRRLAARLCRDDARAAAEVELGHAIERIDAEGGRARLAEAATRAAEVEAGVVGDAQATKTLGDVLAGGFPAPKLLRTGLPWWDAAQPDGAMECGTMTVLAGVPGAGKTAVALQLVIAALVRNPDLRVAWALGEMTPARLAMRILQCTAGVSRGLLRRAPAELSPLQSQSIEQAKATLAGIADRLSFVEAPLTPHRIAREIRARGAGLVVVDFLQLCRPDEGAFGCDSRRAEVDHVLHSLRATINETGCVGVIISNMAKGNGGNVDALGFAKESSEVGYACDAAYVGQGPADEPHGAADEIPVEWRCLKQRDGAKRSIATIFERSRQRFRSAKAVQA